MPAVYGIGQGKAVHRGTTAHVQQNCPLLAAGQAGGIKHVQRFRRAGQAQGNQVCLRQLGVQITQLSDGALRQYSLFDAADYARQEKLDTAVDALREKFGEGAIIRAAFVDDPQCSMAGGLSKHRRTGVTKPVPDPGAENRKKSEN